MLPALEFNSMAGKTKKHSAARSWQQGNKLRIKHSTDMHHILFNHFCACSLVNSKLQWVNSTNGQGDKSWEQSAETIRNIKCPRLIINLWPQPTCTQNVLDFLLYIKQTGVLWCAASPASNGRPKRTSVLKANHKKARLESAILTRHKA